MRKLKIFFIFILLISSLSMSVFASSDISLTLDGSKLSCDAPPYIENGRTMVPVRIISEMSGAAVSWNQEKQQVHISLGETDIYLTIGSKNATVNGSKTPLDAPAMITNNRTMVPVRFIAESFGYTVGWEESTRTVALSSNKTSDVQLSAIGDTAVESGYRITVKFASSMTGKYNISKLTNPCRVVIDVENAAIDYPNNFEFKSSVVKDARIANHDGYMRVVIDLDKDVTYKVYGNDANDAIILIFNTGETTEQPVPGSSDDKDDSTKTVVIDAGHGAKDPGAIGTEDGTPVAYESLINLAVALYVKPILEKSGIKVIMVRTTDTYFTLAERCEISNKADADLFVSIHTNSMEEGHEDITGSMVFYGPKKDNNKPWILSKTVAQNIVDSLCENFETANLGTRDGDVLAVIRGTTAPAVLVELGFITNTDDREKLTDPLWQQKAAQGIADGILKSIG